MAIFPVLRDWITEFLLDNNNMIACDVGHNMLIEQVSLSLSLSLSLILNTADVASL